MVTGEAEKMRARFDVVAAEWDSNPARVALARAVIDSICCTVKLRSNMNVLDFGAGTGLVTLGLQPYVRNITAVDASDKMLQMLDEKLNALQLKNVQTLHCDITSTALPVAEFDVIVSSMVLHHIQDVPQILRRLRPSIRSGGTIALADLESEDGTFHADATGVYHHGFDRNEVCRWLQDAGFVDVSAKEAYRMIRSSPNGETRQYPVVLVTGAISG